MVGGGREWVVGWGLGKMGGPFDGWERWSYMSAGKAICSAACCSSAPIPFVCSTPTLVVQVQVLFLVRNSLVVRCGPYCSVWCLLFAGGAEVGFVYCGDMELGSYAPSLFSSTIVVSVSEVSQPTSGAAWVKHRGLARAGAALFA